MKESYKKGVANHLGLESCAGRREAPGEVFDRGISGRGIELRETQNRVSTHCLPGEDYI